jgi:hypothetical protein
VSSARVEMKLSDARGDGLRAASASTQSRQRGEQNLLAETRWRSLPDSAVIRSESSPSPAWQNEHRSGCPLRLCTCDVGVAPPNSTACAPGGREDQSASAITALSVEDREELGGGRVATPVPEHRRQPHEP